MKKSAFVISLDFELLWGVFDKVDFKERESYFANTRKVIPEILKLFQEYEIHCTWATVGMLFNSNWEEWEINLPKVLPEYNRKELSSFLYGKKIQSKETEFLCFGKELIKKIHDTPNQEIGTHTYSHYYCLEEGQTPQAFRADLVKSIDLAKKMDITLQSLVFPRNQFNEEYLKICVELGIKNVRSNPIDWYWRNTQKDNLLTKIFRTGDAYFGSKNKSYSLKEISASKDNQFPVAQKASRFLRPYSNNRILNNLRLKRIKSEMTKAAMQGEIYHVWWHPHNFGDNAKSNLADLKDILKHYKTCQDEFGMQSKTMLEIGNLVNDPI